MTLSLKILKELLFFCHIWAAGYRKSSEVMSQVPVYSIFKVHEEAPERSQELTPSHTLNKGWLLAGCFSKKLKKFFRDPMKTKKPPFRKRKSGAGFKDIYKEKGCSSPSGNKQPKLYLDVYNFEFLLFCTDYLHQHLINGIGIFSLLHMEVFEIN